VTESFGHPLLHRADGQRLALVHGEQEWTYYALRARVANLLAHLGTVSPGDRVLVLAEPSPFACAAYVAAMQGGGVAVPLDVSLSDARLDAQIELVAPRFAFVHESLASRFAGLSASGKVDRVVIGPEPLRMSEVSGGFEREHDPEDLLGVAALFFASAEEPRAVRIGHDNLRANTETVIEALSLRPGDRTLLTEPHGHVLGATILHTHLWVGGTVHIGSTPSSPTQLFDALKKSRATGLWGSAGTYADLLGDGLGGRELPDLRYAAQSGFGLSPASAEALAASGVPERYAMYGRVEATAWLSVMPLHAHLDKPASIGRGLAGTTLEVQSEEGAPVAPGDVGEIIARGPGVTRGYLDDLEASARHFRDGGLRTSDRATIDEDGFIFLADVE